MQTLNGHQLTIEKVVSIALSYEKIAIAEEAWTAVERAYIFIQEQVAASKVVYGVTTGFGSLASTVITDPEDARALQRNLILSHAVGVGTPLPTEVVRAMMCIRLNTLLSGYSGIAPDTLKLIQNFLNLGIHPIVPAQGSVGASGDLCPLSHIAVTLLGEGEVEVRQPDGSQLKMTAKEALAKHNLAPVVLSYKEGLALINGTTLMNALGVIAVSRAEKLLENATLATALMYEAIAGRGGALFAPLHIARRLDAQVQTAGLISEALVGSSIFNTTPESLSAAKSVENDSFAWLSDENRLKIAARKKIPQDAYCVRCAPQVLGASRHSLKHIRETVESELNAVTDNPLIFLDEADGPTVVSGGNFHGQPLALVLDYLKIAVAEIGSLLERQIAKLHDPAQNDGLPAFLAENPGIHSGMMITQYTCAALVSENKVLAHPASVDSIPTSANQEDHVSMGPIAGRQALEIIGNVEKILAIHKLNVAQAVDLRLKQWSSWGLPATLGKGTQAFYDDIRTHVPYLSEDCYLHEKINALL